MGLKDAATGRQGDCARLAHKRSQRWPKAETMNGASKPYGDTKPDQAPFCQVDQAYLLNRQQWPKLPTQAEGSTYPDPLLLVALHASRPHLLSLDDLLAARLVCKAWKQRLGTAFCRTIRIPHSHWHEASHPRLATCISQAAAAYPHVTNLVLESGGLRPGLQAAVWEPLLHSLNPWLLHNSSASIKCIHLHLQSPPSPNRLSPLQTLLCLTHLRLQHSSQSLYSRHLAALAGLTQLQSLVLLLMRPRLDLRSLGHQRIRRVPLKMDCLSCLVRLTQLEVTSTGVAGELLPDTVAAFSNPSSLAALSGLQVLSLSEAALPGPWPREQSLRPLICLRKLTLVQLDEPGKGLKAGQRGSNTCSSSASSLMSAVAAAAAAGGGAGDSGILLGPNGVGSGSLGSAALALASAAGGDRAALDHIGQLKELLPGLVNLHSPSSSNGLVAPSAAAAAATAFGSVSNCAGSSSSSTGGHHTQQQRQSNAGLASSSNGSSSEVEAVADAPKLPAMDLAAVLPSLTHLTLANMTGERLAKASIPTGLTQLAIHLANPCPGAVTGEQLAAVVLQASARLSILELGLGTRFSLSGGVMRNLKRGLKHLQELTLVEGAQDHLEGLGCWCNLKRLNLIGGRCSVPLRGLYELSMRAAMGRTPGVLRYAGHVRHVEELASRLGSALQELRLDGFSGLGTTATRSYSSSSDNSSNGSGEEPRQNGAAASGSSQEVVLPPLAPLVALTRLDIVGGRLGQLDALVGLTLGQLSQLRVVEIVGQEPWLNPELGVKEQLGFLRGLKQLRMLRLGGVMLGRHKLAGVAGALVSSGSNSSGATAAVIGHGKPRVKTGASARVNSAAAPAVKGLGNGLPRSSGDNGATNGNSNCSKAAKANSLTTPAAVVVAALPPTTTVTSTGAAFLVPESAAAAAALDLAVSLCLEELRRWMCEMLPLCRVSLS